MRQFNKDEKQLIDFCERLNLEYRIEYDRTFVLTHKTCLDFYINNNEYEEDFLLLCRLSKTIKIKAISLQIFFTDTHISAEVIDAICAVDILNGGICIENCTFEKDVYFDNMLAFLMLRDVEYKKIHLENLYCYQINIYNTLISLDIAFITELIEYTSAKEISMKEDTDLILCINKNYSIRKKSTTDDYLMS